MKKFKVEVIVKVPSEKSFVGLFGHHFHKWPTIRIVRSKLTTPRIGIVLFYKWNSYALVFTKKEVTDGQT